MPIEESVIRSAIEKGFPDADVQLEDTVGDQNHYYLKIISDRFKGLPMIQQHRLVYKVLEEYVGKDLHALSLSTKAR